MAALSLSKFYFSKPVVFILGCTGTGKSKLAIEVAKRFNGEVINADAMQLYRGLDIITNKVTTAEQDGVKHHLLGFVNPLKALTVCEYRNLALQTLKDIIDRKKLPVVVGGTFYYVESILYDFTIGSPEVGIVESDHKEEVSTEDGSEGVPPRKRLKVEEYEKMRAELNSLDNEKLYERLREVDPELSEKVHPNSRRKILRAIMVYLQHGKTLSSLLEDQRSQPGGCSIGGPLNFTNAFLLWLHCDVDVLQKRLDDRVDDMLSRGLVDELLEFHEQSRVDREMLTLKGERTGIYQSIGFKEFYDFLVLDEETRKSKEGKKLLEKGVELLKIATKQYARQQKKWMKNRFLMNGRRQVPPIYSLDATDVSKWKENVFRIAEDVVGSHLEGKAPSFEPLPVENKAETTDKLYKCECGTFTVGQAQYEEHLRSKKHAKKMRKIRMAKQDEAASEAKCEEAEAAKS